MPSAGYEVSDSFQATLSFCILLFYFHRCVLEINLLKYFARQKGVFLRGSILLMITYSFLFV
jgi:hypothetical protein